MQNIEKTVIKMSEDPVMPSIPHSSLYVGDLHPSVDERILVEKFSQVGPISHARVCRDITTKYSLGYAYVNFYDPKDAERALQLMNYEMFCNRPIRLMWSQRDPSLRKSGKGNIYIKNLAKNITQKELYDTFETFGTILSSKIAVDEKGNSKGFGYVHFETEESAARAIEEVNGMSIFDQQVYVGYFIPRNARKSEASKSNFNNIYVKSFPPETTNDSLKEMFSEFGEIQSCCVAVDTDGKSKGFGFVCFSKPADAEAAVKAMHSKEIGGRQLYVNRAQRKEERQEELKHRLEKQKAERQSKYTRGVNLYVKNLDDQIDDAALEEAFSSYGSITSAKVMRDAQGRSKGFGFVCFHGADQATKAIVEMNTFLLGSKPLYVALAQRKDERRQKMLSGLNERMSATRVGVAPMMQGPAPGYFQPAMFPRAPAYYQQNMLGSTPRWNRAAGVPGAVPNQMGMPSRPIAGHYLSGPNPPGVPQGHMVQLAHLRSPNSFPRQMMQGSVPNHGMLAGNPQQPREVGARPSVAQFMAANSPNMATVVANGSMRMVQPQPPRPQQTMVGVTPSVQRLNQTAARPTPNPASQSAAVSSASATQAGSEQVPNREGGSRPATKAELGERLFPLVQEFDPRRAAKVTGMLLGLESIEIVHLLQSKEALDAKLREAVAVLDGQKPEGEAPNSGSAKTVDAEELNGSAGADNAKKDTTA